MASATPHHHFAHMPPHPSPPAPLAGNPSPGAAAGDELGDVSSGMRTDYNHNALAPAAGLSPPRGHRITDWLLPLAIGAIAFAIVHPFDLPLFTRISALGSRLSGDLRREWSAWQQYGQGVALIVVALLIWTLDPRRRRRLIDLGLAVALAQLVSSFGKMLIGRPRPRPEFMDPDSFPGPLGLYPIERSGHWILVHPWDRAAGAGADLWSMPSSHTLFAVMLTVFLASLYPRARWIFWTLAAAVASARVVFGAHWPSDVIAGAAAGYAVGAVATHRQLGQRLLDRLWSVFTPRPITRNPHPR